MPGLAITGIVALSLLAVRVSAAEAPEPSSIFNGKDLAGWVAPEPNPFWKVQDGVLIGENDAALKGHVLRTAETYQDFVIELEARWTGEIDSGIIFRKPELQLQFGVSRSLKKDMTCSFYTGGQDKYPEAGRAKGLESVMKEGAWNKVKLQAKGDSFIVWLNGQQVTEYRNAKYPAAGPVGLQIHPGLKMKVEFRNIRIARLN